MMMKYFKSYYVILSISVFIIFVIAAHLLAPKGYFIGSYGISALGSQLYSGKIIMQLGFLLYGGILATGIICKDWVGRARHRPGQPQGLPVTVLIFVYAVCIALTGIFCSKPFFENTAMPYSETEAILHTVFSSLAAIAFGIGMLLQIFSSANSKSKIVQASFLFLFIVIALALKTGMFRNYHGIVQRFLFLCSFTWLIVYYNPKKIL